MVLKCIGIMILNVLARKSQVDYEQVCLKKSVSQTVSFILGAQSCFYDSLDVTGLFFYSCKIDFVLTQSLDRFTSSAVDF